MKVWNGPTPPTIKGLVGPFVDAAFAFGYKAAMNSPEVRAMYEFLHKIWLGSHWQAPEIAEALSLYERGYRRTTMTTNQRDMSASVAAAFLENQDPRLGLMFVCRCGASFQQLTELVNHYEDKHNRPALAPYIPAKFQKEA